MPYQEQKAHRRGGGLTKSAVPGGYESGTEIRILLRRV
jgi:hypothetical protein